MSEAGWSSCMAIRAVSSFFAACCDVAPRREQTDKAPIWLDSQRAVWYILNTRRETRAEKKRVLVFSNITGRSCLPDHTGFELSGRSHVHGGVNQATRDAADEGGPGWCRVNVLTGPNSPIMVTV